MTTLPNLPEFRRQASASALFACLEQQRDPGLDWEYLESMDPYLYNLLPLRRIRVKRRNREGLELMESIRVFDATRAQSLLREIGYCNFMDDLSTHGYDYAKNKFIECAVQAARANQFELHYA